MSRLYVTLALLLGLLHCTSCSTHQPLPAKKGDSYLIHIVRYRGETLSLVSLWYTGSAKNVKALAASNPTVKPDLIKSGTRLRIPRALVRRAAPLPKGFLQQQKAMENSVSQTAGTNASPTPTPTAAQQGGLQAENRHGSAPVPADSRRRQVLQELLE